MKMNIVDIQHFCVQDGPGIRTTIFMKGCPLSCKWCHNPESQKSAAVLMYYEEKCIECGMCRQVCPRDAHIFSGGHTLARNRCVVCGQCTEVCSENALRLAGRYMSFEEVICEIRKDRMFHTESGGGVTFSGGEPLVQSGTLLTFLKHCRNENIHTAVETSAYAEQETFMEISEQADLMICDLKAVDAELHRILTGVNNEKILHNIQALDRMKPERYWIRIPLIPGCNDSEKELTGMVEYLLELHPSRIEILPYHDSGVGKYKASGRQYSYADKINPSEEWKENIRSFFRKSGVNCVV